MHTAHRAFKLAHRYTELFRGLGVVASYTLWIQLYHLISITLVTYFVISSGSIAWEKFILAASATLGILLFLRFFRFFGPNRAIAFTVAICLVALALIIYFVASSGMGGSSAGTRLPKFQDITDTYSAYELIFAGTASFFFILILAGLYPLASTRLSDVFWLRRIERNFLPGFAYGAFFAAVVITAFLINGQYHYQGSPVSLENAAPDIAIILTRIAVLLLFVFSEEYLFRGKILGYFQKQGSPLYAALLTSVAYSIVKIVQFNVGIMQVVTLFLFSMALSIAATERRDFARGAGFWAGLLILFHSVMGLPILGNESNEKAILLIQYQAAASNSSSALTSVQDTQLARFLTGGLGGPLSSFSLQLLLCIYVLNKIYRWKKSAIH